MKTDWDLTLLYKSEEDWEKDYQGIIDSLKLLKEKENNYLDSTLLFLEFIKLRIDTELLIDKVYSYCKRIIDVDFSKEEYKKKASDTLKLYGELEVIASNFENAIINSDKTSEYLKDDELKPYKRYISLILRRKKHILSNEKQDMLKEYSSKIQEIKEKYQDIIVNKSGSIIVDIDGEEVTVNRFNINDLLLDVNSEHRRLFEDAFVRTYYDYDKETATLLISKLKADIELSKAKGYDSLLSEKMFTYQLSNSIFRNLINKVNDNLELKHKYNTLRKEILGFDSFHSYDTALSICEVPKIEIELESGLDIIKNSLSVLGRDYVKLIDKMFEEGWVDVYPKKNKVNRSYTSISYFGVPYIFINYNKSINSVRNLAHEIGHAINVVYSREKNMYHEFSVSFFLTEVASKVNEMLIDEYILTNSDSIEEKKYILYNSINSLINSIFGQTMLSEFEDIVVDKISKNEEIDSDFLNNLYLELNKRYNGKDYIVEENQKYGWMRIPHFYLQETYYNYQYAIGACIALYIVTNLKNDNDNFKEKYLEFLSLGDSVSIEDALKTLGIDVNDGYFLEYGLSFLKNQIDNLNSLVLKK